MKATYNGITYEIGNTEDIELFKQMTETKKESIVKTQTGKLHYKMVDSVIKNRKHQLWTDDEIKLLLANKDKSKKQLAKLLGRSADSIKCRLWILSHKNSVVTKTQNGLNDYQNKVLTYYNDGTKPSGIAKLLNIKQGKLYRTLRQLKKLGYIKSGKNRLYAIKKKETINSLDNAIFDFVSTDKMQTARDLIDSCIKTKTKFSMRDSEVYLGLTMAEAKIFLQDVWQQQEKLGYKVKLEDNALQFE